MTFMTFSLYAQDDNPIKRNLFNSFRDELTWAFWDDTLEISQYIDNKGLQKNEYNYTYTNKGPYYILTIEDIGIKTDYVSLLHDKKYFVLLYPKDSTKPLEDGFFGKNRLFFDGRTKFKTENYLTEGKVKYLPENLADLSIGKPWVEASEGPGIGDKIIVEHSSNIMALVISNGFVSYKPTTFYNNNRVKKLKITNRKNEKETLEITLPDNATPTEFELPFLTNELILEILEVYKGEKYDDTCINFILCKYDHYASFSKPPIITEKKD